MQHDTTESNLVKVAKYVRMSTEHQRYSTENQSLAIDEYAQAHSMAIVRTYEDQGKSGLNIGGREALQRLLNDAQTGNMPYEAILVYDVSRWGRFPDPDEAAYYEQTCKRNGIRIVYCAEQFTNDNSLGSTLQKSLKRSMAAEYSRELSVKVFAGQKNLVQRGFHQGGAAGFGLRRQLIDESQTTKGLLTRGQQKSIQTDRVVLVPGPADEVAVVRRIYDMFLRQQMPERVIASVLNREGLLTDFERPWTRGTVHQILTNEKYVGNNVFNRTSFKLKIRHERNPPEQWIRRDAAFEAIVPPEDFKAAAGVVRSRARHLSDAELLDCLRKLLFQHGGLSGKLINETDGIPSTAVFSSRFGTLLDAYNLVGFKPERDFDYLQINRGLAAKAPELAELIGNGVAGAGGSAVTGNRPHLLNVNGELSVAIVPVRCRTNAFGRNLWTLRGHAEADITVAVRMDARNENPVDYYVLPSFEFDGKQVHLGEGRSRSHNNYRFDELKMLYSLTARHDLGT